MTDCELDTRHQEGADGRSRDNVGLSPKVRS